MTTPQTTSNGPAASWQKGLDVMQPAKLIDLRPSSMGTLMRCVPSVLDTTHIRLDSDSGDAAGMGSALHQMLGDYVKDGAFDIKHSSSTFGLDESHHEEMMGLMRYGMTAWKDLSKYFPKPVVEAIVKSATFGVGEQSYRIKGTVDVLGMPTENAVVVVDWKSGWVDKGHHDQMAAYAYAIWDSLGRPNDADIRTVVVYLRHHRYDVVKFTPRRLEDWHYDLTHNVLSNPSTFSPGRQCEYCTMATTCEARNSVVEETIRTFFLGGAYGGEFAKELSKIQTLLAGAGPDVADDPEVGRAVDALAFRVKMAQQQCDLAQQMIKDAVTRAGHITLPDGSKLEMAQQTRRSIDGTKGLGVLRKYLSDQQIADNMTIKLAGVLGTFASQYNRGKRKDARKKLEDELDSVGAIRVTNFNKLVELPPQEPDDEPDSKDAKQD